MSQRLPCSCSHHTAANCVPGLPANTHLARMLSLFYFFLTREHAGDSGGKALQNTTVRSRRRTQSRSNEVRKNVFPLGHSELI